MHIHYVLIRWLKYSDPVAATLNIQVLSYELINPVLPTSLPDHLINKMLMIGTAKFSYSAPCIYFA